MKKILILAVSLLVVGCAASKQKEISKSQKKRYKEWNRQKSPFGFKQIKTK